jgi:hypothetical protein
MKQKISQVQSPTEKSWKVGKINTINTYIHDHSLSWLDTTEKVQVVHSSEKLFCNGDFRLTSFLWKHERLQILIFFGSGLSIFFKCTSTSIFIGGTFS